MQFEKWQGCGNDFVLIDRFNEQSAADLNAKMICDRHFGIGSDGLIVALPSKVAEVRMQMFNPDGSEAEMCGNGIRCFAKFVRAHNIVKTHRNDLVVETGAGVLTVHIEDNGRVTVDMGEPILAANLIPVNGVDDRHVINQPITIDDATYKMTCVSMGNPHCVVFVDAIDDVDLPLIGPKFETHEMFPRRINTEFIEVIDRSTLRMRVWERGAGITLACGTGACAAAVAAALNDRADRHVKIILDGGTLQLDWRDNNHVFLTGEAVKVFVGSI